MAKYLTQKCAVVAVWIQQLLLNTLVVITIIFTDICSSLAVNIICKVSTILP